MEWDASNLGMLAYGNGAGCACKIDWQALGGLRDIEMFKASAASQIGLLDAGAAQVPSRTRLVASIDFVGPVARRAQDCGFVAAVHSLSDLFAVGVAPRFALVIAAWPREIQSELRDALDGMHKALAGAGVNVLGGHTAYSEQPLLGACVIGIGPCTNGATVRVGDALYTTKPLGTGVAISAMREGACPAELEIAALEAMRSPNVVGLELADIPGITLVSDVTGFGLIGQALRVAEKTGFSVALNGTQLPALPQARELIARGVGSSAAERNWGMFKDQIGGGNWVDVVLASDPQTNGPLLVVADSSFEQAALRLGIYAQPIGYVRERGRTPIIVY